MDAGISSAPLCSGQRHKRCSRGKMEPEKGCFLSLIRFEGCERRGWDTDSCSLLPGDKTFKSGDQFVANSVSFQPPAGERRRKKKKNKTQVWEHHTELKCSSACQVSLNMQMQSRKLQLNMQFISDTAPIKTTRKASVNIPRVVAGVSSE